MSNPVWAISVEGREMSLGYDIFVLETDEETEERAEGTLDEEIILERAKGIGLVPSHLTLLDLHILLAGTTRLENPTFTLTEIKEKLEDQTIETENLRKRLNHLAKEGLVLTLAKPIDPAFEGTFLTTQGTGKSVGALTRRGAGTLITFPEDPERGPLVLAHELGHLELWKKGLSRLGHHEENAPIGEEEAAWRIAAKTLRRSENWTTENKVLAAEHLSTYYRGGDEEEKFQRALDFMNRI